LSKILAFPYHSYCFTVQVTLGRVYETVAALHNFLREFTQQVSVVVNITKEGEEFQDTTRFTIM